MFSFTGDHTVSIARVGVATPKNKSTQVFKRISKLIKQKVRERKEKGEIGREIERKER